MGLSVELLRVGFELIAPLAFITGVLGQAFNVHAPMLQGVYALQRRQRIGAGDVCLAL